MGSANGRGQSASKGTHSGERSTCSQFRRLFIEYYRSIRRALQGFSRQQNREQHSPNLLSFLKIHDVTLICEVNMASVIFSISLVNFRPVWPTAVASSPWPPPRLFDVGEEEVSNVWMERRIEQGGADCEMGRGRANLKKIQFSIQTASPPPPFPPSSHLFFRRKYTQES